MRLFTITAALFTLAFLGFGLLQSSAGVEAGTALRMGIPDLVDHSALVLEARVLSSRAVESEGFIETEYLLQVDRTFQGPDEPYRSVRIPGGVLEDGRGMVLAGMPRITEGEDLLLFLSPEGSTGLRMPVGLAQGKFRIVTSSNGLQTVVQDTAGVSLVTQRGALVHGEGSTVLSYADVVAQIEAALASRKTR